MCKPEDISQDAWEKAVSIAMGDGVIPGTMFTDAYVVPIARAIMAAKAEEREACALEADAPADAYEAYGAFETANEFRQVAHAIRKRGEG
jgi:hypothetical protein